MTRPLLVIDGDSFAHRSYHALPKTIRRHGNKGGGAILGFANFLVRLYESEQPRAANSRTNWSTSLRSFPTLSRHAVSRMPRRQATRPTISSQRRLPRRSGARGSQLWPPAIGMPFSSHQRRPPFFSR